MGKELAVLVVGGALAWSGGSAIAHHSFAMFDTENPLTVEGTVQGSNSPARTHLSFCRSRGRTATSCSGTSKARARAPWSVTGGRARASSPAMS